MTSQPRSNRQYSYAAAREAVLELLVLLKQHGVEPRRNGVIDRMATSVVASEYLVKGADMPPETPEEQRNRVTDLMAFSELAVAVLRVRNHPDLVQLLKHVRHLDAMEEPRLNRFAGVTDREANKAFELFIASLAMDLGTDVDIAPPGITEGRDYKHPDVQVTINGQRWAFECKVLQRTVRKNWARNLWSRIEDGVEQINAPNLKVDVGLVIVSLRNLLDHDAVWIEPMSVKQGERLETRSAAEPRDMMVALAREVGNEAWGLPTSAERSVLFAGGRALEASLLVVHGAALAANPHGVLEPTSLKVMVLATTGVAPVLDPADLEVIEALNHSAQEALPSESPP